MRLPAPGVAAAAGGGPGGGDREGAALWKARLDREEVAVAPRRCPHSSSSRLSGAGEQKRPSLEDSITAAAV